MGRKKAGEILQVRPEQTRRQSGVGSVAVVGESLVGFRHLVGFFALANSAAGFIGRIHQLAGKLLSHAATVTSAGEAHKPAKGHGRTPLLAHFHRNLIGGTPDASGTYLNERSRIFHGRLKQFDRIPTGAVADQAEGIGQDSLCRRLLSVLHQPGHEHGGESIVELRIWEDRALDGGVTARHELSNGKGTEKGEGDGGHDPEDGSLAIIPSETWRRTWNGTGGGP